MWPTADGVLGTKNPGMDKPIAPIDPVSNDAEVSGEFPMQRMREDVD
jgi:hypothetical protein